MYTVQLFLKNTFYHDSKYSLEFSKANSVNCEFNPNLRIRLEFIQRQRNEQTFLGCVSYFFKDHSSYRLRFSKKLLHSLIVKQSKTLKLGKQKRRIHFYMSAKALSPNQPLTNIMSKNVSFLACIQNTNIIFS